MEKYDLAQQRDDALFSVVHACLLACLLAAFLGVFAKLRKTTVSFVISAHPPVRPQGTTRLPLDEFS